MEEINLKDLFNYFWSKKLIIALFVFFAILLSCLYGLFIQKPMYQSSTTIVLARVNDSKTEETGITQNDVILNQKLVSTYREIIKSRRILNQVIANLSLDTTTEDLQKRITVTNEKDTELIRISVSDEESLQAKEIANEIARVFSSEIVEIYSIKNISVIDYAERAEEPYNVHVVKQVVLAALVGFALSCALVFVMFYFDTTIKSVEEVEEKLGLPILGSIPMSRHKKQGGVK